MEGQESGGIVFPMATDGSHSTTLAGARILAAALRAADPALASMALAERHWRRRYPVHFRHLVEAGLRSPETALDIARAGLDAAWETMRWQDGEESLSLREALEAPGESFQTVTVQGHGDAAPSPWVVPYRGSPLSGDSLRDRLHDWQQRGIIEAGAARALLRCAAHPEWFDLSDRTLVVLGAGSEAGPLSWLARWRANLAAIDIPRAAIGRRIADTVSSGNGTLHMPVGDRQSNNGPEVSGADLIRDTPAVVRWLLSLPARLDIGAFAYLDGERHVRVSMAMDMIMDSVCSARSDTTLAYLATPTDVFAVSEDTAQAAMTAYQNRPLARRALQSSLRLASGDRFFQPNVERLVAGADGLRWGVVDSLVLEQGPNYALAKRLQQWRAMVARAAGHRVSLNVAPSTTTTSVVRNPALAAGFAGADSFGIEAFEPQTTNALMAALWVHDLRCDEAAANPSTPLAHPYDLLIANACHGGLWRSAYLPRSALPFAAALGWVRQRTGVG